MVPAGLYLPNGLCRLYMEIVGREGRALLLKHSSQPALWVEGENLLFKLCVFDLFFLLLVFRRPLGEGFTTHDELFLAVQPSLERPFRLKNIPSALSAHRACDPFYIMIPFIGTSHKITLVTSSLKVTP